MSDVLKVLEKEWALDQEVLNDPFRKAVMVALMRLAVLRRTLEPNEKAHLLSTIGRILDIYEAHARGRHVEVEDKELN